METKAEGLQVAEWEGWCAQSPWDVLLHVRGIHGNTGERGTVRPPPDDSLEGASTSPMLSALASPGAFQSRCMKPQPREPRGPPEPSECVGRPSKCQPDS